MKRLLFFLIFHCIIISACSNDNSEKSTIVDSSKIDTTQKQPTIEIGFFTDIPDEIDGCACYFARSINEYNNKHYLYVNDFANLAFISINGKIERLKLISSDDSKPQNKKYKYSNELYTLDLEIKSLRKKSQEISWMEGLILIKNKTGQKVYINFVGECGC